MNNDFESTLMLLLIQKKAELWVEQGQMKQSPTWAMAPGAEISWWLVLPSHVVEQTPNAHSAWPSYPRATITDVWTLNEWHSRQGKWLKKNSHFPEADAVSIYCMKYKG